VLSEGLSPDVLAVIGAQFTTMFLGLGQHQFAPAGRHRRRQPSSGAFWPAPPGKAFRPHLPIVLKRRRMRARLGRILAWAVTATALGWLFWKTPIGEVWASVGRAAPWTIPAAMGAVVLVYVADSFAMWKTFGWFLAKLPFRDVLIVRGATYLLAAINYSVGQGAIVYFVHRARGVPVMRGVATVLLIMGTNVLVLLVLVTGGLGLGAERPAGLVPVVVIAWAGLAAYVALVIARPRWLLSRPVFDVLLSAGLGGHLKAMIVRLPHIAALIAFNLAALRGFGVAVPLGTAVAALPVIMFIAVLPISVQGLGTTQAAMVLFFARFVPAGAGDPRAVVLGASLSAQAAALSFQVVTGLVCLRSRTARGLGDPAQDKDRQRESVSRDIQR
jgi:Lysylphosphatidylglycerol synthase TM region